LQLIAALVDGSGHAVKTDEAKAKIAESSRSLPERVIKKQKRGALAFFGAVIFVFRFNMLFCCARGFWLLCTHKVIKCLPTLPK
jgi:hypothetical protein